MAQNYLFITISQYCAQKCLVCISPKQVNFVQIYDLHSMYVIITTTQPITLPSAHKQDATSSQHPKCFSILLSIAFVGFAQLLTETFLEYFWFFHLFERRA